MPNKTYAAEWLTIAKKNLETARILFRENHYTDIIAIEIQQTVEKALKAIWAVHGVSIRRTHFLPEIFDDCKQYCYLEDISIDDILIISDYIESKRYPGPGYFVPSVSEIEKT